MKRKLWNDGYDNVQDHGEWDSLYKSKNVQVRIKFIDLNVKCRKEEILGFPYNQLPTKPIYELKYSILYNIILTYM